MWIGVTSLVILVAGVFFGLFLDSGGLETVGSFQYD